MIQALNILIKDLRRHRWEIALYLVSIVGWATQEANPNHWIKENAGALFPILMFVVWFLLIIRVVQGESLTGTREFWTTRPYRAGPLIAAKLAFVKLFIHAPFFFAQCWLLTHAGFALTAPTLLRLCLLQLEFFVILTLPAAALAAITASIVQWVLAIIAGVLAGFVITWFPWSSLTPSLGGTELLSSAIGFVIVGALLIAVLLWQYNRRHTLCTRILFGAAFLVVPLCIVFASTSPARLVAYPAGPADAPIRLTLPESPEHQYSRWNYDPLEPVLKFNVEGVTTSPDTVAVIEGVRLHFSASDGWSHESEWTKEAITLSIEADSIALAASVPAGDANRIAAHANVEAEVALALYHLDAPRRIDTSSAAFEISAVGRCKWSSGLQYVAYNNLTCTAPVRLPAATMTGLDSADNTCPRSEHSATIPAGHHAEEIAIEDEGLPIEFDPSPIRSLALQGAGQWEPVISVEGKSGADNSLKSGVCPGTPITLRTGRFEQRMRVKIELGPLGREIIANPNENRIVNFMPRLR
ncbi:MAG TPA: hypothetical protein VGJ21_05275 [Terracidiphilus sp.]|jgi:hypothetical protein